MSNLATIRREIQKVNVYNEEVAASQLQKALLSLVRWLDDLDLDHERRDKESEEAYKSCLDL